MMKRVLVLFLTMLCLLIGGNPAWATIDTETSKVTYTATAGLTAYPYTFKIFEDSDLAVIVRDSAGIEYTQTLTTDYTVSGVGIDTGGTVTFVTAPYTTYGSGATVVIQSAIPYTQRTDFLEGGRFSADTLEGVLDKNTRLVQQVKTGLDRALKFPVSSTADPELPDPLLNAGRLLRFNLAGDAIDTIAVAAAGVYPDFTAYCDPADLTNMRQHTYQALGYVRRSKFTYASTTTITIGPGVYEHVGSAYWQTVFWVENITFTNTDTSTGWKYLYIDNSTLTAAPSMLTASNFVASATAPSWSAAKQGWYNGDDRCVFAYLVFSNVIVPFLHDGGDFVQHGVSQTDRLSGDLTAAVEVSVSIPAFSTRGKFTIATVMDDARLLAIAAGGFFNYHVLGYGIAGVPTYYPLFDFYTSSAQKLTLAMSDYSGTNMVTLWTNGWYFPSGM